MIQQVNASWAVNVAELFPPVPLTRDVEKFDVDEPATREMFDTMLNVSNDDAYAVQFACSAFWKCRIYVHAGIDGTANSGYDARLASSHATGNADASSLLSAMCVSCQFLYLSTRFLFLIVWSSLRLRNFHRPTVRKFVRGAIAAKGEYKFFPVASLVNVIKEVDEVSSSVENVRM